MNVELGHPTLLRITHPDGSYDIELIDESWPIFILVDDAFAATADPQYYHPDETGLSLILANASARYRKVGQHRYERRTLYELVEGSRS